jgi:hypothetical protein
LNWLLLIEVCTIAGSVAKGALGPPIKSGVLREAMNINKGGLMVLFVKEIKT